MEKEKFLKELKECLEGDIPEYEIKSHIEFYDDYFNQKIKEGKTAKDVVDEIGSPRLIAKTLKNTSNISSNSFNNTYEYSDDYSKDNSNESKERKKTRLRDRFRAWLIDVALGRARVTNIQKVLITIVVFMLFIITICLFYFILDLAFAILPIIFLLGIIFYFFSDRR